MALSGLKHEIAHEHQISKTSHIPQTARMQMHASEVPICSHNAVSNQHSCCQSAYLQNACKLGQLRCLWLVRLLAPARPQILSAMLHGSWR